MSRTIEIGIFAVAILVAALAVHAWLAARDDAQRLQSTLAAQKQLIDAATTRETARDATLQQTLAQIDALKRATQTPAEILRNLPKYLPLPAPITLAATPTPATSDAPAPQARSDNESPARRKGSAPPRDKKAASSVFARLFGSPASSRDAAGANSLPASANRSGSSGISDSPVSDATAIGSPVRAAAAANTSSTSAAAPTSAEAVNASDASGTKSSSVEGRDRAASLPASPNRVADVSRGAPPRLTSGSSYSGDASVAGNPPSRVEDGNPPAATATASPAPTAAEIPAADLKPLYDYVQDCRACQANLAAAKQNASDDAAKISALTQERNAAVTAAKGGSAWQRLRRNIFWLAVGAAVGYAAHR